jgi:hypothetical protein
MSKWILVLICCILLISSEVYAEYFDDSYLRTSIGYGQMYGGTIGLNGEYVLNEYLSGQLGVGYLEHVNMGVVGGITGYPIKNNQYRFSPRLTALYGRVGRVDYTDGDHKSGYGYALGIGVEHALFIKLSSKLRFNVDIFYATITNPIKSKGDVVGSFGVGYSFK